MQTARISFLSRGRVIGVAADASVTRSLRFSSLRIPPVRELSGLIAWPCALAYRESLLSVTEEPAIRFSERLGTPR